MLHWVSIRCLLSRFPSSPFPLLPPLSLSPKLVTLIYAEFHSVIGTIYDIYPFEVTWKVPYVDDNSLLLEYSQLRTIFKLIFNLHPCNKWEMMRNFSIPFLFFPIVYNNVKFYAMPLVSIDVLTMLHQSTFMNVNTGLKMLPIDDLNLFADRLVSSSPFVVFDL